MKTCTKCQIEKELSEFHKNKSKKDGLDSWCRECFKEYYQNNKNQIAEYYQNNKNQILKKRAKYRKEKKYQIAEYIYEYKKNKLKTDPLFKKIHIIRRNINRALQKRSNGTWGTYIKYLGCNGLEYAKYIESLWTPAMSWENYGCTKDKYWQIDHIIPVKTITCEEDMFKVLHYSNTRPLSIKENYEKGSKII